MKQLQNAIGRTTKAIADLHGQICLVTEKKARQLAELRFQEMLAKREAL
jgi:hypothetical protein